MTPTTSGRTWQPVVVGFALAAITVAAGSVAPRGLTVTVLGVILAGAAAVYPGAALHQGDARTMRIETAMWAVVAVTAVLGLWHDAGWLALGYLIHGLWDGLHHPRRVGAGAGRWFPPFCLVYDVVVAGYIWIAL